MKRLINITLSTALLLAAGTTMACEYPNRVLIPNGSTATKEEMIEGMRAVRKYVDDMEAYLICIVDEETQARAEMGELEPDVEQEREDMLNKKYNAADDEKMRLAAQFNAEVQAYNARQETQEEE